MLVRIVVPFALMTVVSLYGNDFPICQSLDVQATPEVIYADGCFYVFWSDFRYSSIDTYSVYGSRVMVDGTVLDPEGKEIFANKAETRPAAAYDGSNLLVVLQDSC
ncbi:MAG: hypothetical protein JSU64_02550 [candidate division WOR-3 bacterium]|nr:MAG: hypothetical protein JSU64_02550 [candidate division WOR-3 bacterium]